MSDSNPTAQRFDPLASKSQKEAPRSQNYANTSVHIPVQTASGTISMTSEQLHFLQVQGFPIGMIRSLQIQKEYFPVRIWMLDNSSFMHVRDAHILHGNYEKMDHVTRWEELKDCVAYHADIAARFLLPSRFALLNDPKGGLPQYFSLVQTGNLLHEQQILKSTMTQTVPHGPTPLTAQLRILQQYIVSIASQLRAKQQIVPIIIATQGLPTNDDGESSQEVIHEFVQMLRSFEQLPVYFVVRLCTDDEQTFVFYNSLDARLIPPLDVLDDFYGEALEVYLRNPWLTYAHVLHRYREMGFRVPVLDTLDERALTLHELRELCHFLFDEATLPDAATDWNGFIAAIQVRITRERPHWNPIKKAATPWIDLAHLNEVYGQQRSVPVPPRQAAPPSQPFSQSYHARSSQTPPVRPRPPYASAIPPTAPAQFTTTSLVKAVETHWAKQPPTFTMTRPLAELLGTISVTFSLVDGHEHFTSQFQSFSAPALSSGGSDVLKRAVRKMRFFLHPDRLPKDFNEQQKVLCRTLWDTISDAWDSFSSSTNNL